MKNQQVDLAYKSIEQEQYLKAGQILRKELAAGRDNFNVRQGLTIVYFNRFREAKDAGVDSQALISILDKAIENGEEANYFYDSKVGPNLFLAQSYTSKFLLTNDTRYNDLARTYLQKTQKVSKESLEDIESKVTNLTIELQNETAKPAKFCTRKEIFKLHQRYPDAIFYDTSTNAPTARNFEFVKDLSELSPFIPYGNIPVPKTGNLSDSVEGVWQGLKIINGKIDPDYFKGKGRQRKGNVTGHKFGNVVLNYIDARKKIFVPTYKFMTDNIASTVVDEKVESALNGELQFFFDVDDNAHISNPKGALAHSSVLVNIINNRINDRLKNTEQE